MKSMTSRRWLPALLGSTMIAAAACAVDTDAETTGFGESYEDPNEDLTQAREDYARYARERYDAALTAATELQAAIDTFTGNPTAGELNKTKLAYLTTYEAWMATEALRSYGGPVDATWGRINAWRMDPGYIDYTSGTGENGIINDPTNFPSIDVSTLTINSQLGTDRNVSGGLHAIEFLLWGEDLEAAAAGKRPAEDYTTAPNAERRKQYLAAAAELLVQDLTDLSSQWAENGTYTGTFLASDPQAVFGPMLQGMRHLAGTELAGHFIGAGLAHSPEMPLAFDELSPFADRTPLGLQAAIQSIADVYRGQSGETDLAGLEIAVAARAPDVDERIQDALDDLLSAADEITGPYETSVLPGGPDRAKLQELENQLWAFGLLLEELGPVFSVEVNFGDDGDDGAPRPIDMMN